MSVDIVITTPNHDNIIRGIQMVNPTVDRMDMMMQQVVRVAEESLLTFLQRHFRTGQTFSSIRQRTIEKSDVRVAINVGTTTRGAILRWLDRGRRDVYPIRAKMLRWLSPEGIVIFSRHSRATQASGCMANAANEAMARAQGIINQSMQTPSYLV